MTPRTIDCGDDPDDGFASPKGSPGFFDCASMSSPEPEPENDSPRGTVSVLAKRLEQCLPMRTPLDNRVHVGGRVSAAKSDSPDVQPAENTTSGKMPSSRIPVRNSASPATLPVLRTTERPLPARRQRGSGKALASKLPLASPVRARASKAVAATLPIASLVSPRQR